MGNEMKALALALGSTRRSHFILIVVLVTFVVFCALLPSSVQGVSNDLVISQVYGGGGNAGATFRNDFIEIFNRGTATVTLDGKSVQYAPATSRVWQVTPLSGTLEPGQYYLVQQASGGPRGADLPTPDLTANPPVNMSTTTGRVAIVNSTQALNFSCPLPFRFIDYVGYGSGVTCRDAEGPPTPNLSNILAALRHTAGCTDSDNNSADFIVNSPSPRNSGSPINKCGPATSIPISAIQGSGITSPYNGQIVTTGGIVTALKVNASGQLNGFFIQTPDDEIDDDPNTSEGLFVFSTVYSPPVGTAVRITGRVIEFAFAGDPFSPTLTEISAPSEVTVVSTVSELPTPVRIRAADTDPAGDIYQLEKFEGMRVYIDTKVDLLQVTSPTYGSLTQSTFTSTTNGVFYATLTGIPRPFREPGVQIPDLLPPDSPPNVPRFDANPERLRIDSKGQFNSQPLNVNTGAIITGDPDAGIGITGVLDYGFRTYTILPDPDAKFIIYGGMEQAVPVPGPKEDEFTIGSFNMHNFYDDVPNGWSGEVVMDPAAFNDRLNKASRAIREVMQSPDIIGFQEVENLETLERVAAKTLRDGGPDYQAELVEVNNPGNINVGFLIKKSRVTDFAVTQVLRDERFAVCEPCTPACRNYTQSPDCTQVLYDRPPLVLEANIRQKPYSTPLPITVIVNHLRSLINISSITPLFPGANVTEGKRVRLKRKLGADNLANLIQTRQASDPNECITVIGDFNAFPFNDGYVDVIGTIKGTPTPEDQVVLSSPDLVEPDLINLVDKVPANERYSYTFDGNAQVLDHVLVNVPMSKLISRFYYARGNADFYREMGNNAIQPERTSDHDMPVAYFRFLW